MNRTLQLMGAMLIASIGLSAHAEGFFKNPASAISRPNSIALTAATQGLANPSLKNKKSGILSATRAESELKMDWGYCGNPDMAYDLGDAQIEQCIYVTPEQATAFKGDVINSIMIGNPLNADDFDMVSQQYRNAIKQATVWIRESLTADPVTKGTGATTEYALEWSDIKLATPYTVKENTGFYVGVSISAPAGEQIYCVITDNIESENKNSNLIYTRTTDIDRKTGELTLGNKVEWRDLSKLGNACIRPVLIGENLPKDNVSITDYVAPTFVKPGEKFQFPVEIYNEAANTVDKVTVTLQIKGQLVQECTCDIIVDFKEVGGKRQPVYGGIAYGEYGAILPEFTCNTEGSVEYTLTIAKTNGNNNNADYKTVNRKFTCLTEGFAKNNVVEAATATWDGYCPIAYAGMEYLTQTYGNEGFIGIALHCDDEMNTVADGVYGFMELYIDHTGSLPHAFMNRDYRNYFTPDPTYYQNYCKDYEGIPSIAQISASIVPSSDPRKIKLNTETKFAVSENDATYAVAYVVVEDNVGPYEQTNYYSVMEYPAYGFEDMDFYVPLVFNSVARNCSEPQPIAGSLPGVTSKDETYKYSADIELTDVDSTSDYRIVAMVINTTTKIIENACQVISPTYGDPNSVGELVSESPAASIAFGGKGMITVRATGRACDIHTIDGTRVASGIESGSISLPAGLYIVSDGKTAAKTLVF